jgi:hypothetical protein
MIKICLAMGASVIIGCAVLLWFSPWGDFEGNTITQIKSDTCSIDVSVVESLKKSIAENIDQFSSTTTSILDMSTEGGVQTNYTDSEKVVRLVIQKFYGETFRSEVEYYYKQDSIFMIDVKRYEYIEPIFINPNPSIAKVAENKYILNIKSEVCEWYSDGEVREADAQSQAFVDEMLKSIVGG